MGQGRTLGQPPLGRGCLCTRARVVGFLARGSFRVSFMGCRRGSRWNVLFVAKWAQPSQIDSKWQSSSAGRSHQPLPRSRRLPRVVGACSAPRRVVGRDASTFAVTASY